MTIEAKGVFHNVSELFKDEPVFIQKNPPTETFPKEAIAYDLEGKEIDRAYFCNSCAGWIKGNPVEEKNILKCRICGNLVVRTKPIS